MHLRQSMKPAAEFWLEGGTLLGSQRDGKDTAQVRVPSFKVVCNVLCRRFHPMGRRRGNLNDSSKLAASESHSEEQFLCSGGTPAPSHVMNPSMIH